MSRHTSNEEKLAEEQSSPKQKHEDQVIDEVSPEQKAEEDNSEKEDTAEKIAGLEAELADLKDQYLRKAADFENFRKRMNQEKQNAIDYANQSLLLDIIPILDDFERAIKSADTSMDFSSFHEGVSMIAKRLVSELENKWGLKRYESENQPFNPEIHEAIMMDKSADVSEPTVAEDFLKGYMLKDRVVRSAKVKVLMPAEIRMEERSEENGNDTPAESEGK